MSQLTFLLQDVFTFLSLVSADDIRPLGARYLSTSALAKLNARLVIPDQLDIQPLRHATGHWRAGVRIPISERHTERIRFVHYLTESARLVARTGAFLKPTPLTAQWLHAPLQQRAQILFRAAFPLQPTHAARDDKRWRAFGLPGDHLPSPLAAFDQLLDIFRQVPIDQHLKTRTLLKLLALPAFDDDRPDDQPEAILRAWLKLLQWFQIVDCENGTVTYLTPIGATLIEHPEATAAELKNKTSPLHWTKPRGNTPPNLIAPLDASLPILWELGEYADHTPALAGGARVATLSSTRQTRRLYQLDAARVRRALDRGTLSTIAHLHEFLERATGDALPRAVTDWLDRIAHDYGRVTMRSVTLLEVKDPSLLTELTHRKSIRQCLRRSLSPRAVVVRPSQIDALAFQVLSKSSIPVISSGARNLGGGKRDLSTQSMSWAKSKEPRLAITMPDLTAPSIRKTPLQFSLRRDIIKLERRVCYECER